MISLILADKNNLINAAAIHHCITILRLTDQIDTVLKIRERISKYFVLVNWSLFGL